jgi:protease-4
MTLLVPLLSGCVLVTGTFSLFDSKPQPLEERVISGDGAAKVLLLEISNVITSQEDRDGFGWNTPESTLGRVEAELTLAAKDDAVKAIVVRINSPGGTVNASDSIFHQLRRFKDDEGIAVVAHFMDVAASGGYYVALAADEIVASPTTVTGSVGAVAYGINVRELMSKIGVGNQTIKSGAKKDIGSPLREMTPEEREVLQSVIDGMRDRFVDLVRERRPNVDAEALQTIADGRIFGADQALAVGLVDRIGYLEDAIEVARRRARLHEARVIMYRRPQEYSESIYSRSSAPVEVSLLRLGGPGTSIPSPSFLYMWMPDSISAELGSIR